MKNKLLFLRLALAFLVIGTVACNDDDDSTPEPKPIDKGDVVANRYIITFSDPSAPGADQSYEYYDPDGSGGNPATVADTIKLTKGRFYNSRIEFLQNNDTVTAGVETNGVKYIVCYRNFDALYELKRGTSNQDSNGKDLGTETSWEVVNDVKGDDQGIIRVTLNYQAAVKEGLCDAGVRIIEGSLPYKLN
jgi:hypothetical protein